MLTLQAHVEVKTGQESSTMTVRVISKKKFENNFSREGWKGKKRIAQYVQRHGVFRVRVRVRVKFRVRV